MNALSEFLKELDPSQIDEAVELLQRIKKTKKPSIGAGFYSLCSKNGSNQLLQGQNTSNNNLANNSQENFFPTSSGFDADERPLMYTHFARSPDFEPNIKSDRGKVTRRASKKATYRSKPFNSIGHLQDRAGITMPFHQEELPEKNIKEINQKASSATSVVPVVAICNLNSFGFLTSTAKATDENQNRMFPLFLQDKRQIPEALQFWRQSISYTDEIEAMKNMTNGVTTSFEDDESSLLHPPMCLSGFVSNVDRSYSFNSFMGGEQVHSHTDLKFNSPLTLQTNTTMNFKHIEVCNRCPCRFHCKIAEPYKSFNNEVIFFGFFAIGYDPCQARPSYFGTYNYPKGESHTNEALDQIARFPVGEQMPQFSDLDYDYDSGDDWDVMDGDDIGVSSSSDYNSNSANDSFDSSDLDFINDDDDDSDCELYRRVIEARQRRLNRLRGKDKLVPLFSGPFVGITIEEHPLRRYDRLELLPPFSNGYLSLILENELQAQYDYLSDGPNENTMYATNEETRQQKLMKAALRNRREMTDDEISAVHNFVKMNSKVSTRIIISALRKQHMCVGVARAEIERTVKRFYEKKRGILLLREQPWLPTDERLFGNSTKQKFAIRSTVNLRSADPQSNDEGGAVDDDVGEIEDIGTSDNMNLSNKQSTTLQANEGAELNFPVSEGYLFIKSPPEAPSE